MKKCLLGIRFVVCHFHAQEFFKGDRIITTLEFSTAVLSGLVIAVKPITYRLRKTLFITYGSTEGSNPL